MTARGWLCVFFRPENLRLKFRPEDGMKVLAFGQLTIYERGGQYQLRVAGLKPAGVGELQLAFDQLKSRLSAEGLFDQERKRPLPAFPAVVGVVTSSTGAAVRDIIAVIRRRCPVTRVVLLPVRVQGEGAAGEIARAIEAFGRWGQAEVLIVGRGGGSIEDLWAFNEEAVARAIAACPVPVVSAVGHETDFTIADFVADLRAPTPSVAGECVVPELCELEEHLAGLVRRLGRAGGAQLRESTLRLDQLERELSTRRMQERLRFQRQHAAALQERLTARVRLRLAESRQRWLRLCDKLSMLNPAAVLGRGYAVARDARGAVLRQAAAVAAGEALEVILGRGRLECTVDRVHPEDQTFAGPQLRAAAEQEPPDACQEK